MQPPPTGVVPVIEHHAEIRRKTRGDAERETWIKSARDRGDLSPHGKTRDQHPAGIHEDLLKQIIQPTHCIPSPLAVLFPVGIETSRFYGGMRPVPLSGVVSCIGIG